MFQQFKKYKALVDNQFQSKLCRIRSDNGEVVNLVQTKCYNSTNGIATEFTTPYNPQQNGVAERLNRTLVEKACALTINARMPNNLWEGAILTTRYILNRCPTRVLQEAQTAAEL